jgi:hypothetical protein
MQIVGPTLIGFFVAPLIALAVGIYVAYRYGGDSQPRRQAIAVGTILLAVAGMGAVKMWANRKANGRSTWSEFG